ncbi:hypothetical protein BOX15_Mlig007790g1 [Macrostomum lignano]|uniref:c-SKI SMAD4-binding domain-containing protein n=1 Tax=Macrostomum lignano TaxID=282301 RepID=A0A267GA00_9PLAT|nr:hypothetical protein BOX15_Mlig007790g1 [Macrostomum lignano]
MQVPTPWLPMPLTPSLAALQHAMNRRYPALPPPPLPPLLQPTPPAPPPLQSHRPRHQHRHLPDSGRKQPDSGLLEACLEGRTVLAFSVGGEKRLCLPQVLHEVLLAAGLSLQQIELACDRLGVLCQRCDARQMSQLRHECAFDPGLDCCGLITQSDAERLCKLLLAGRGAPLLHRPLTAEDERINVRHLCFGKQRGLLLPQLYTSPRQPCIVCTDCRRLYTPVQFVGHVHRPCEVATCHWGFESANWRHYLLLDSPLQPGSRQRELLQAEFDSVKGRFLGQDGARPLECSDIAITVDYARPLSLGPELAPQPMEWQQQQPGILPSPADYYRKIFRHRLFEPNQRSPQQQQLQQQHRRRGRQRRKQIAGEVRRLHRLETQQQHQPHHHNPRQQSEHRPTSESTSNAAGAADFAPNRRLSREAIAAVSAAAAALDEVLQVSDGREAEIEAELRSDWEALADWAEGHLPEKATPTFLAMVDRVKAGYAARIGGLRRFVENIRQQLGVLQQLRQLWNRQQLPRQMVPSSSEQLEIEESPEDQVVVMDDISYDSNEISSAELEENKSSKVDMSDRSFEEQEIGIAESSA